MNLQEQKENLEYTIKQLQEQLELVNQEIEKQNKKSPKSKFFFKVGEKHPIFFRTKQTEVLEVVEIDLNKNLVWVLHNGIKKKFVAEAVKNGDNKITTFSILVDKRTNNRVLANVTL